MKLAASRLAQTERLLNRGGLFLSVAAPLTPVQDFARVETDWETLSLGLKSNETFGQPVVPDPRQLQRKGEASAGSALPSAPRAPLPSL